MNNHNFLLFVFASLQNKNYCSMADNLTDKSVVFLCISCHKFIPYYGVSLLMLVFGEEKKPVDFDHFSKFKSNKTVSNKIKSECKTTAQVQILVFKHYSFSDLHYTAMHMFTFY